MRILIVEDERSVARTLTDLLVRHGYSVESVHTGEDGLLAVESKSFDLMILDVMLPGIDGFEVCHRARSTGIWLPIILLTARGETRSKIAGLKEGADDYMTKPFDPEELLARIEAQLRRAAAPRPSEMRLVEFEAFQIDFVQSQIIRGETTTELSDRELRLLKYFVENKGKIVTREELLQEVWGYQSAPFTRTVDVHIAWLRQKLEAEPKNPHHLITVHGQGYRFVA